MVSQADNRPLTSEMAAAWMNVLDAYSRVFVAFGMARPLTESERAQINAGLYQFLAAVTSESPATPADNPPQKA